MPLDARRLKNGSRPFVVSGLRAQQERAVAATMRSGPLKSSNGRASGSPIPHTLK